MHATPRSFDQTRIDSPIGPLLAVALDTHLVALDFADYEARMHRLLARRFGAYRLTPHHDPAGIRAPLARYFAGDLHALDDLTVATHGTPFQERAWTALRGIRAGRVATYGEQAARIGAPQAARAVGLANSLNPVAIVVPCHRVIGSTAKLTGYAGGLDRKRWLLAHEGVALDARKTG